MSPACSTRGAEERRRDERDRAKLSTTLFLIFPLAQGASKPQISVVLAYRNARPWLSRCLLSLAAMREVPFELVAVDNGSSDGSRAWLEHLCQTWNSRSLQSLHTSDGGVSAARNLGAERACAPLIAFLDADDRAMPGRLLQPLQALHRHPELSHVHGGWLRINSQGHPINTVEPWQEGAGFALQQALLHKAVLPSAWTLRRSTFLRLGGFDPALSHAEDVDLLLRLAAAGFHGAWIPEPLCRYRVHPGSASRQLQPQIEALIEVTERHLVQLEPLAAAEVRYTTLCWCSWRAWQAEQPALALELLGRALPHCPLPLPRRPVHMLENMARSCRREGLPWDRKALLQSNFSHQARQLLLASP